MKPAVELAIQEIKAAFPHHPLEVTPEKQGGAYVIVKNLPIGEQYIPTVSWVGFLISFQYPDADVYPHFINGNIKYANGSKLSQGFSGPIKWQEHPAIQVSRRLKRLNPAVDTAAIKLTKVLSWLRRQ